MRTSKRPRMQICSCMQHVHRTQQKIPHGLLRTSQIPAHEPPSADMRAKDLLKLSQAPRNASKVQVWPEKEDLQYNSLAQMLVDSTPMGSIQGIVTSSSPLLFCATLNNKGELQHCPTSSSFSKAVSSTFYKYLTLLLHVQKSLVSFWIQNTASNIPLSAHPNTYHHHLYPTGSPGFM